MDARDTGDVMGWTALGLAAFASCLIPGTLMLVIEIGLLVSNTGGQASAGKDWKQVATQIETLKNEMGGLVQSVPADRWQGHDRRAFEDAVDRYRTELTKAHEFHGYVGEALDIVSWVLFGLAALALVVATIMFVEACMIIALASSIVGALAIPSFEAGANAEAGAFGMMLSIAQGSVRVMLGVVLGILTAGSMANLPQQQLTKATGGTPTFKQVTLDYRAPQIPTLGSAPTA
jgi:hypothetical protein